MKTSMSLLLLAAVLTVVGGLALEAQGVSAGVAWTMAIIVGAVLYGGMLSGEADRRRVDEPEEKDP